MKEKIKIYDLNGNFVSVKDRSTFYKKIKNENLKNKKFTQQIKTINIITLNSKGKILLQIRNNNKSENPGLYDKTVGGHVQANESFDVCAIRESAEELGLPISIIPEKNFKNAISSINLKKIGIFRKIETLNNYKSTRVMANGNKFIMPFYQSVYIGYYDGGIQFVDGESSGIRALTVEELESTLKKHPYAFTEDLKFLFHRYKKLLKPINKL